MYLDIDKLLPVDKLGFNPFHMSCLGGLGGLNMKLMIPFLNPSDYNAEAGKYKNKLNIWFYKICKEGKRTILRFMRLHTAHMRMAY